MPGKRGLELLPEIRAIDPAMPVVMVTQSEEEALLREAIGIEVDDYLVKPVHPRQILSVITRLLEGDRIRQQRLARDFVTRFRELEARRGTALAWREWIELVVELTRWEVRLSAAQEPGLLEALRNLQESLRKDFAEFFRKHYPKWLANPEGDRPPLSVDVGAEFLAPVLKAKGKVLFLIIDCLRLDQWEALKDLVTPLFDIEESYYYGIVPSATPFARNSIFSGMFPMEIAARHPEWWGQPSDEESLNAHEPELLSEQLADLLGKPVPVRYEKLFTSNDGPELLRKLPAHLAQEGVTALVFNFIDQLTHGRSESAILYEVARDSDALRGLTRTWFERSPVRAALAEAERRGVPVLLALLRPYTSLFAATVAATVVSSVLDGFTFVLLIPFLRSLFGEAALPAQGGSHVEAMLDRIAGPFLHAGAAETALRNVVIVLLVALVLKNVTAYAASYWSVVIQEGVVRDLRVRLFQHLQTLPLGYFQRTRPGQTVSRLINDTNQVKTLVTAALPSLLHNGMLSIVF